MYFIDFEYTPVVQYLKKNLAGLSELPYDKMEGSLFGRQVITSDEMEIIKAKPTTKEKMQYLIVKILIVSLKNKFPNKFLDFLDVMESNEDLLLQAKAKKIKVEIKKCKLIFSDMCIYSMYNEKVHFKDNVNSVKYIPGHFISRV